MNYNIPPKKTTYNGVNFRSRLEARWAAFFDLVKWEWEYEPSEINGYNPDFLIRCKSKYYPTKSIIVEVKPSTFTTQEFIISTARKYKDTNSHILILTDMPFGKSNTGEFVSIGIGCQYNDPYEEPITDHISHLEMKCVNEIGSVYCLFDGMIYGKIDREAFVSFGSAEHDEIIKNWKKAGEKVKMKNSRWL